MTATPLVCPECGSAAVQTRRNPFQLSLPAWHSTCQDCGFHWNHRRHASARDR